MDKAAIGRLGLWAWLDSYDFGEAGDIAARAEQLGYGTIWIPEAVGRDPFVTLAVLAQRTTTLKLATGIANIYARDAVSMKAARNSLDELSGGRLVLGLGVSHSELVEGLRQHDYGRPLSTMTHYLDDLEKAAYAGPAPQQQGILVLAALRKKMLGLAGSRTQGAHPYFVTPEHTARAREIMGPEPLLAPEQKVLLVSEATEARRLAREAMAAYLALPNYRNNLLTLGFTEADLDHGGSDRLVDAIVAWGDADSIYKRIEAHWNNGADHVALQILPREGGVGVDVDAMAVLAPAGA